MRTIYLANYESAQQHLVKTLEQTRRKANMLSNALDLLEEVKHYKSLTKRVFDVVQNESFYCYAKSEYTYKVNFVLTNRTWNESNDYFESYEETFYFSREEEQTPTVLMAKVLERLMALREEESKLEKDLKRFDSIYKKATKLAEEYNAFGNNYSFTVQNALEI